jgi:type IV pilus assembly protein PilV
MMTLSHRPACTARRVLNRPVAKRTQSGVSLIEVLVAVVILSIGFLGIAALQAMSLSTNNSALARSMATVDSYSILDAMRADLSNAATGSYNTTVTANSCPTTTGTVAQAQLTQWCGRLGSDLGAVSTTTGAISCATVTSSSSANATNCTVTVQFSDNRSGNGGTTGTSGSSAGIQTIATQAIL